jgi:hypothetical protein
METPEELTQASESEFSFNPDVSSGVETESEFDNGFDKLLGSSIGKGSHEANQ